MIVEVLNVVELDPERNNCGVDKAYHAEMRPYLNEYCARPLFSVLRWAKGKGTIGHIRYIMSDVFGPGYKDEYTTPPYGIKCPQDVARALAAVYLAADMESQMARDHVSVECRSAFRLYLDTWCRMSIRGMVNYFEGEITLSQLKYRHPTAAEKAKYQKPPRVYFAPRKDVERERIRLKVEELGGTVIWN